MTAFLFVVCAVVASLSFAALMVRLGFWLQERLDAMQQASQETWQ